MIEAGTLDRLRALAGDRVQTTNAIREQHSRDESGHAHALPDAVLFAESTDDVSAALRLASADVDICVRGGPKPSDHAPLWVKLAPEGMVKASKSGTKAKARKRTPTRK